MHNIVVLGAGFAGLRCALKLARQLKKLGLQNEWSIVLFDKNSYHTYTPALYEAASAYIWTGAGRGEKQHFEEMLGGSLSLPISEILEGKHIIFVRHQVTDINFESKVVRTADGGKVSFTYLVFALGSQSIYFDIKGAEACCYGLKTLYDALRIRRRIEEIVSNARKDEQIKIAVVGGGATGVETIAEVAKYAKHLAKDFKVARSRVKLFLLEAEAQILLGIPERQRRIIEKRLRRLGVTIRTLARISEVENTCVVLEGGERCAASITLWAAGVKGPRFFENISGFELDKRGRLIVDEFLRVKDRDNIFAIGDNALFLDEKTNNPAPSTAFIAEQQADAAAKNILSLIKREPLQKYKIEFGRYVISCGGKYAVAHIGGITCSGFLGWAFKRLIDLRYFLSILPFFKAYSLWLQELRMFTKND